MAGKKGKLRERQIGKKQPVKKHLIDPRYKNAFWTAVVVIVLIIFFIINNTRDVPERGPYPPNYDPAELEHIDAVPNKNLYGNSKSDTNNHQ